MLKAYNLDGNSRPAFPDKYCIVKSAVLNRTDLAANNNKFYVLEVHEASGQYRLFTHYGRVGTEGVREGRYANTLQDVLSEFERLYREKTSKNKGYVPVDIKQTTVGTAHVRRTASVATPDPSWLTDGSRSHALRPDFPNLPYSANSSSSVSSILSPDLARFVERIYDATKSELVRRIETPLGSLSFSQIERGQDKLREIRFAIARRRQDRLVSLTSEYFSLVPHRFGPRIAVQDVVIDTVKKADDEEDLLQLMRDVFHVQDDLEADVDRKYRALGAQMCVLDRQDPDYQRVERKIRGTQSWRHNTNLRVKRIFAIRLPYERARFHAEGEPLGNVQELFHGTQNCNMVGILSRGLLIAPKNAPCTGAMFGKGIYFADQSSKSAGYCGIGNVQGRPDSGYMFLADVALGRVKKERVSCYREQAPDGYDSVQGCKGLYLAHNEFIIYRPSQCTLRYIAEIETHKP